MATYTLVGGPLSGQQRTIPDDLTVLTLARCHPPEFEPADADVPASVRYDDADYVPQLFVLSNPVRKVRALVYVGMSDTEACEWLNKNA